MKKRIPVLTLSGVLCILSGIALLYVLTTSLDYNFLGIFLIFTGASLLVPVFTVFMLSVSGYMIRRVSFPFLRLSLLNLNRSLSRMVVSISSLMIMISVFIGIGLMTGSFRESIIKWSQTSIVGDLIISSSNELTDRIPEGLDVKVKQMDLVADVIGITAIRNFSETTGHFIIFSSADIIPGKNWIHEPEEDITKAFQTGAVFVSEVFAFQNGLTGKEGEFVMLNTQKGRHRFRVAGIFQDFFTGGGRIEMSQDTLKTFWGIDHMTVLHVFAAPGVKAADLEKEIQGHFEDDYSIRIRENEIIRERIIEAFDHTFMITIALQLLSAIVAVIGIFNSAMAVFSEREREFGTLRACGLTRIETGRLMVTECGLCGVISGVLSIPLGLVLAWILVFMINKRSFGWSYDFILNYNILIQALLLSVLASVAAGLLPAIKSATTDIPSALSYE